MFGFLVRPLNKNDEPFLWEMLYQAIYVPEGQPLPPRSIIHQPELAKYVEHWGQPGDTGFAAVDPLLDQPVGACWLRLLTGDQRGYGWVSDDIPELSIAMLPEYRGKGLGSRLIQQTLEEAKGKFPGVSLSVSRGNPAEGLYRRMGFEEVAGDENSSVMSLMF